MGGEDYNGWRWCEWVRVPWWHPRRWLGYSWRRWHYDAYDIGGIHDGQWQDYQTHDQRARHHLAMTFGGGDLGAAKHRSPYV